MLDIMDRGQLRSWGVEVDATPGPQVWGRGAISVRSLPLRSTLATSQLTAKGAATRQRIVRAAADLVLERGAEGTSLDTIRAASARHRPVQTPAQAGVIPTRGRP